MKSNDKVERLKKMRTEALKGGGEVRMKNNMLKVN